MTRFGRFAFVGLLGMGWQLGVLYGLAKCWHAPIATASGVAVEVAVVHNFLWHSRFTWGDRKSNGWRGFARFQIANGAVSLLGNTLLTYSLVEWLRVPPLLAAVLAIAVCALVNFLLADRWVFTHFAVNNTR